MISKMNEYSECNAIESTKTTKCDDDNNGIYL